MIKNLSSADYKNVTIDDAKSKEQQINKIKSQLKEENLNKLGTEDYNIKSAMVYNNLFTYLENVGDHIYSISESIVNET